MVREGRRRCGAGAPRPGPRLRPDLVLYNHPVIRKLLPHLLILAALSGCALQTQRFDLVYKTSGQARGGRGEILLAKPFETHGSRKDKKGRTILGKMPVAGGGWLVTQHDIGEWIAGALSQELTEAGFAVRLVTALPEGVGAGLEVTIFRILVKHEATPWGSAAPSELGLRFKVFSEGAPVKTFSIDSRGDYSRTSSNFARQKSFSLRKALQVALEQAVPEIIRTLGGREEP